MWQQAEQRSADIKGTKGFALPGATRHYAPNRQAEVSKIVLEIWVNGPPSIRGRVSLELVTLVSTERLQLDARELEVARVTDRQGTQLEHRLEDGQLTVLFPKTLAAGEELSLSIEYSGEPRRGLYFIEPSEHEPSRPREVWTQGQDDDSRHWFPCFDYPNQKAKTEVIAHVPRGLFALSNGHLIQRTEDENELVFHYRQDIPHATYLVTLVVGEYVAIEHAGARVPVISYVHPQHEENGRLTFSRTAEMVELFSNKIGIDYPYPRYSQICVADFIFGGMENTSATTLTEHILFDKKSEADYRRIAEGLIAHELAHQWWGDLVTCSDWSHAWLNEGFATYFETVWREHGESAGEASYARLHDQEAYFAETYRRPLVEKTYEEPIDLFDRHHYEKGSCVLHLIRFVLGDADFWRVLQHYGQKHRGKSVESDDLRNAVREVTGKNLESLFDQWVYAPGHPQLTIGGAYDAEEHAFNLTVEQTQRGDRVPDTFVFPVDIEVATEGGSELHRVRIESRKQTIRIPSTKRPHFVVFDKGGNVLKQLDNRLPASMLRAVLEKSNDVHALINAARTLSKRGDPSSVRAVIHAMQNDTQPGVRAEAAKALKRTPLREVKDALLETIVEDGDPRVRRTAIRALGGFKSFAEEITEVLSRHVESEGSDYAQADALRTVAELRDPKARAFLERGLKHTGHNHCVRAGAIESFAKLRDVSALPLAIEHTRPIHHARVREAAASTVGVLGRFSPPASLERAEAHEKLVSHLDDPWLRVRIRAAEALKGIGDKSAIGELRERADRELDGRARRAMKLAEREIREEAHSAEEVERLRDEVRTLEQSHARLSERLEKLEARKKEAPSPAAPVTEEKKKRKKKKKS
jgi:aminopeptidase N